MSVRKADSPATTKDYEVVYRHTALVRLTHWINTLSFLFLIPSGVAILIAHPEFYWGETGYFGDPTVLSLPIEPNFEHTSWGRGMHFAFAWLLVINGLVYLLSGLLNGHFRRKLLPSGEQLRANHILREIHAHLQLRRPVGEGMRQYNVLQKISYLVVVFILFPLILLTGLAMSPALTSVFPDFFSLIGRQSARTIHFIAASLLLLFLLVHVFQVFVAGAVNEMRAMITGRFTIDTEHPEEGP